MMSVGRRRGSPRGWPGPPYRPSAVAGRLHGDGAGRRPREKTPSSLSPIALATRIVGWIVVRAASAPARESAWTMVSVAARRRDSPYLPICAAGRPRCSRSARRRAWARSRPGGLNRRVPASHRRGGLATPAATRHAEEAHPVHGRRLQQAHPPAQSGRGACDTIGTDCGAAKEAGEALPQPDADSPDPEGDQPSPDGTPGRGVKRRDLLRHLRTRMPRARGV